ncbi:hypothetical protein CL622_05175 [archaeon]|nr:hypothetical protein [archaeon]|tara:strand:+ start:1771 stop:2022 length:252 start_codon:yes stop_codon:yes gene_type:complete
MYENPSKELNSLLFSQRIIYSTIKSIQPLNDNDDEFDQLITEYGITNQEYIQTAMILRDHILKFKDRFTFSTNESRNPIDKII